MITVLSTPPLVALTGNPVRFRLQTDNHFEDPGQKPRFAIQFQEVAPGDATITFTFNNTPYTFTFKPAPDDSGWQLSDGTVEEDLNSWVALIASELALNYQISRYWIISVSDNYLYLDAREHLETHVISFSREWPPGYPPGSSVSGDPQIVRAFFRIGLQLLVKVDDEWVQAGEDRLPVDENGVAAFDIHKLFADYVYPLFTFPEASDQLIILRDSHCREYRIRYYETWGLDETITKLTESGSFYILSSGISRLQEAIYNRKNSSYWEKLTYNQWFLTWQPKTKLVTRYQVEKLYYLLQQPVEQLILCVSYWLKSGEGNHREPFAAIDEPEAKKVYEFCVTPNTLQVPGYDSEHLDYYQVWLEDGLMNRISEVRTFRMDHRYHEEQRHFLFRNSLGGYDTLRVTGDQEDNLEFDRVSVSKILQADFTEQDHQLTTGSASETRIHKANTGFKTRAEVAWIRDFFLSKQVYQVMGNGLKLVPVIITNTQAFQRRDREDLFAIEFEYRRAFQSEYYTWEMAHADFSNDFIDDFANE